MPRTEAQKEWRRNHKQINIVIQVTEETKTEWNAYARSQGKPLATLIRGLMAADMAAHGWTGNNQKPEDV